MRDYTRIARKITAVLFMSQGLSSAGFIAAFTVNALVAVLSRKRERTKTRNGEVENHKDTKTQRRKTFVFS